MKITPILRKPRDFESDRYDIIIVGGGIYGAMLLLESARRNLRALMLEKGDFGSETSFNSLRIIHGGLRYLQTLDLPRFRESVAERSWYLRTFPDLVKPMPCLMPLYNQGVKRKEILKIALTLNDLLSTSRNRGIEVNNHIQNGRILNIRETCELFPGVVTRGLKAAGMWYDAHAPDTQRIIMETLLWSVALGSRALNYVEVKDLLKSGNTVSGVSAIDHETGDSYEYRSNVVINATGPSVRQFSRQFDRDNPDLFRPSVAWNILFKRPSPSSCALALTPDRDNSQTYFLHPWKGRLFVGTGHAAYTNQNLSNPAPSETQILQFIEDVNLVIPDAKLTQEDIERVYYGCLPVTKSGGCELTRRAVIYDHSRWGGLKGLFSISGVKLTTARYESERMLNLIFGAIKEDKFQYPVPGISTNYTCLDYDWMPSKDDETWKDHLRMLIKNESVVHLDDLIYRRTSIGDNVDRVNKLKDQLTGLFE